MTEQYIAYGYIAYQTVLRRCTNAANIHTRTMRSQDAQLK